MVTGTQVAGTQFQWPHKERTCLEYCLRIIVANIYLNIVIQVLKQDSSIYLLNYYLGPLVKLCGKKEWYDIGVKPKFFSPEEKKIANV